MAEGFRFIRTHTEMKGLIVIAFCMTLFAFPMLTFFLVFTKNVFHSGPELYANLLSISGVGSIVGALTVAGLGDVKRKGLIALGSLVLIGGCIASFALSRNLWG